MRTVAEIAAALAKMTQHERKALGAEVDVPFETVQKIAIGQTENPRAETYLKLCQALDQRDRSHQLA